MNERSIPCFARRLRGRATLAAVAGSVLLVGAAPAALGATPLLDLQGGAPLSVDVTAPVVGGASVEVPVAVGATAEGAASAPSVALPAVPAPSVPVPTAPAAPTPSGVATGLGSTVDTVLSTATGAAGAVLGGTAANVGAGLGVKADVAGIGANANACVKVTLNSGSGRACDGSGAACCSRRT